MKRLGIFSLAFLALSVVFAFQGNTAKAAFGISPPFLNADHLVAGATYEQTVYLVQDQPNEDLQIKTTLSVPEKIIPWITIDQGLNFTIPKGMRQFPVQITVRVPNGEPIGKYSGNLSFTSQPAKTGQVTIALGVNVAINLTVGTGIYEKFSVPLVALPAIEEGWNPQVYVKFINDGNVPEAFDAATFDVFDQYDDVHLAQMQKQDGFPETAPFTTNEYTIEFPTSFHLGVGEYWGSVVLYQHGQVVASQKTIFHVLKAGSLRGVWASVLYSIQNSGWPMYGGILLVVIVIAGIIWGLRRRSKKAHRSS
jgi:hypothetical protein